VERGTFPTYLRIYVIPANVAFATEPVWAQNPDSQPTKLYPFHN